MNMDAKQESERVCETLNGRIVRTRVFWRGKFFAVVATVGPDKADARYSVVHLPTGYGVRLEDVRREAERVAKRLDAQDAKVWGSRHWRFGRRPDKERAFYKAAWALLLKVTGGHYDHRVQFQQLVSEEHGR